MKTESGLFNGPLLAGLCGAAFFVCAKTTGPVAAAGLFLRYDLVLLPVLAAGLFFFLFARLPKPLGSAAAPLLAACLCGLVLAGVRDGLISDLSTLAGLYPHSDGRNYLNGALNLLHGQQLNSFASRRPLSVVFWAALLRLSGMNIKTAMELMVLLCALSIGWTVRESIRRFGWAAGWLFFGGLFFFYRRFIGTFLTEHLGLALGCCGFLLLLRSLDGQRRLFASGLLLLTLALNVRAGAFFILPALAVWAGWRWRQTAKFSFAATGLAVLAISLGFALNSSALRLVGQEGAGQGNFSFTLYGLVHGGDWTLVKEQHPEVLPLEEVERHHAIYKLAFAKIAAEPTSMLHGAARAWIAFASISQGPYSYVLFSLQQSFLDRPATDAVSPSSLAEKLRRQPWKYLQIAAAYASSGLLLLLAGLGFFSPPHRQVKPLLLFSWLGILASVPFVPPWDADLMRAYAATLPFLLLPAALGLVVLLSWCGFSKQTAIAYEGNERGLLLPISITLLTLLLPILFRPQKQAASPLKITCQKGEPQLLSLLPGSVLHIGNETNPADGSVSAGQLRARTGVLHSLNPRRADAFQNFSLGQALALGYEPRTALLRYVVFSSDKLTTFLPQTTPVCASPVYDDGMITWWSIRTE